MPPAEHALIDACRTLFGDEVNLGPDFLTYLQPSGAKVAFRNQVKLHHPDRFAGAPREVRVRQTERFREIHQAYSLLNEFLAGRRVRTRPLKSTPSPPRPSHPKKRTHPPARPGHRSALPPLPLVFGTYAFYSGKIDYRDLIDALVWQRRQRPALGTIACQWGWLTEVKVRTILNYRGSMGRFGQKAVALDLLTPAQVESLLLHQRTRQQRLGEYFIDRGLMTASEAERLARDLEQHNARFAGGRG